MTIHEIKKYLNKHYSLIFKYQSEYYTLIKRGALFSKQYCLITTEKVHYQRKSLEELCEQVYIVNGTLLAEAIQYMEIHKWNDPAWETYEAVRHSAIVHRDEIHFLYNQRYYWIAHTSDGLSHLSDDLSNTQVFNSCCDLFECARIDGKSLKDIWPEVVVDTC